MPFKTVAIILAMVHVSYVVKRLTAVFCWMSKPNFSDYSSHYI